jgi:hypothetical protein
MLNHFYVVQEICHSVVLMIFLGDTFSSHDSMKSRSHTTVLETNKNFVTRQTVSNSNRVTLIFQGSLNRVDGLRVSVRLTHSVA